MDARSGRGNVNDRKYRQNVKQTWRAVSTQPDRSEGNTFVAFAFFLFRSFISLNTSSYLRLQK